MNAFYNRLSVVILFLMCLLNVNAQIEVPLSQTDSSDVEEPSALLIVDVIDNLRKTQQLLVIAKKRTRPSSEIARIDSLLPNYKGIVQNEKKATFNFIKANPNRQKVDNYLGKWRVYEAKLQDWKSTIINQIQDNAKVIDELNPSLAKWAKVKSDTIILKAPEEFLNNINLTITDLEDTFEQTKGGIISYLKTEAEIDNLITEANEASEALDAFKRSNTFDYLYRRHGFLWNEIDIELESDTITIPELGLKDQLRKLKEVTHVNANHLIEFILMVVLVIFLVRYLKRSFIKYPLGNKERYLIHVEELFLKHDKVIVVFSCLLLFRFFTNDYQRIFIDVTGILLLVSALPIIRPYEDKFLRAIFTYIVILVVIDTLKTYAWFSSFQYRILLLIESIIAIGVLYYYVRPYNRKKKTIKNGDFVKAIVKISPVLFLCLTISIVSNLVGYTNLTDLCLKVCILMGGVSIIFYAALLIAESAAISIINRHYGVIDNYSLIERKSVEKKVLNVLKFLIILLWFMFFLKIIDKLDPLYELMEIQLTESYKVGSIEFTLGAILLFFIVLFSSYILSSLVAFLINDGNGALKVFKLPKGIPTAISVIIRYVIIGFGFIFAISILGVDLSTFNLMAGALGLGIGFGLQTIISNFVSGLILIFERPILPGDSVEVDNLWGTVNKVGVRASVINTYDGAEVIVPNNNLITNDLINWTLSSKIRRMEIKLGTAYGSNPNEVMEILNEAAKAHPAVLKDPPPLPLFQGFGDSSLDFTLWYWVYFENGLSSKSEISIDIYNRLKKAGIEIPFPQRDLHIKSLTKGEKPNSDIGFKSEAGKSGENEI
jgi:potassium efflux system protein